MKTKRLLIMGPPGAGKGTQAANIVMEYGICHISTGDMFRAAIREGTDMGKLAQSYIDNGNLVPDSVTIGIVRERLAKADCMEKGFLLDGFPRNLDQAEALDQILTDLGITLDGVINVSVDNNILIDRIIGRRLCKKCGASYHVKYHKPRIDGICDICGSELYTRADDSEETAIARFKVYELQTEPLLDFYRKRGQLIDINGDQEVDVVFEDIMKALEK